MYRWRQEPGLTCPNQAPELLADTSLACKLDAEMCLTPEQDELFRAAAEVAHMSKTAFILSAAAERAQEVVHQAQSYTMSNEAFDKFLAEPDEPAFAQPALVDLFKRAAK